MAFAGSRVRRAWAEVAACTRLACAPPPAVRGRSPRRRAPPRAAASRCGRRTPAVVDFGRHVERPPGRRGDLHRDAPVGRLDPVDRARKDQPVAIAARTPSVVVSAKQRRAPARRDPTGARARAAGSPAGSSSSGDAGARRRARRPRRGAPSGSRSARVRDRRGCVSSIDDAVASASRCAPEHRAQHVGQRARAVVAGAVADRLDRHRRAAARTRRPACAGSPRRSASPSPTRRAPAPSARRAAARAWPGAGSGRRPCSRARPCRGRARPGDAVTRATPRRSSAIAAPVMSTIASTAPTSWKCTLLDRDPVHARLGRRERLEDRERALAHRRARASRAVEHAADLA